MSRARSLAEKSGTLEHALSDELDHLIPDNSRFKIVSSTEVKVLPARVAHVEGCNGGLHAHGHARACDAADLLAFLLALQGTHSWAEVNVMWSSPDGLCSMAGLSNIASTLLLCNPHSLCAP